MPEWGSQTMPTELTPAAHSLRVAGRLGEGATSSVWALTGDLGDALLKLARAPADSLRLADEAARLLFAECPEFPRLLAVGSLGAELAADRRLAADASAGCLVL